MPPVQLNELPQPLYAGEIHYWRLDPDDWPVVLDSVAGLGFRTVSVYVPWSRHETGPGRFDFTTGSLDVGRFIDLVTERGLQLVVRPGPNAGAELEDSGWPRRILDDPECQARRPDGRPYLLATSVYHARMPSYGSRKTLSEVARWYDAVIPLLAAHQWPDGPIVGCHVDNEMGFHFQGHAFALDYHPDTVAQWAEFLAGRYGDLSALARAYGQEYAAWDAVPAPTDGREQPERRRLDWIAFREHHIRRSLSTLAGMQRERGMDRVPLIHNDYPRTATPLDPGGLESSGAVDVAAGDVYAARQGGRYVRDYARWLAGSTRFPYMAEMGSGWITLPWLFPMVATPADVRHVTWRALSGGIRGFNVFMLVERDRWFGSPIKTTGEVREEFASFYRRLLKVLELVDWPSLRRQPEVLFLENRHEGRRDAARAVRGDLVPALAQMLPLDRRLFDGDGRDAARLADWERGARSAADGAGVDWDWASTSAVPPLERYRVVVVPSLGCVGAEAAAALGQASARGTAVVCGPDPVPGTTFTQLEEPAGLVDLLPSPPFRSDHPAVDLTYLAGADREILIAINGGEHDAEYRIDSAQPAHLTGLWRPEDTASGGTATLEGWGVQVYQVRR